MATSWSYYSKTDNLHEKIGDNIPLISPGSLHWIYRIFIVKMRIYCDIFSFFFFSFTFTSSDALNKRFKQFPSEIFQQKTLLWNVRLPSFPVLVTSNLIMVNYKQTRREWEELNVFTLIVANIRLTTIFLSWRQTTVDKYGLRSSGYQSIQVKSNKAYNPHQLYPVSPGRVTTVFPRII